MKKTLVAMSLLLSFAAAHAADAPAPAAAPAASEQAAPAKPAKKEMTAHQKKMGACSKEAKAKDLHGKDRKAFMSDCLKKD